MGNKNLNVCELLNVELDKPFDIKGQNGSNPYIFKNDDGFTVLLIEKTGEEAHNWIICRLIDGSMEIQR